MNETGRNVAAIDSETLEKWLEERAAGKRDFVLVDVREPFEYEMEHIVGVDLLLPSSRYGEWIETLRERHGDQTVVLTCRTANRTGQLQPYLQQMGYTDVVNHLGGILSYTGPKESGMQGAQNV
jgi:adenylyltransferase/sulfurtransferase